MTAVLQGYLIGNGVTDSATDNINIFSLFSAWPLIPETLAANLTQFNCGTLTNPIGEALDLLPKAACCTPCELLCGAVFPPTY